MAVSLAQWAGCNAAWFVRSRCTSQTRQRAGSRRLRVQATSWDPEGLFKSAPQQQGLIDRKLFQKEVAGDKEFAAKMAQFAEQQRLEVQRRRESRTPPEVMEDLVEFFLNTEAPDMEWEVARCRPRLTPEFFAHLDRVIGLERFCTIPDQERLAELETLRDYLKEGVEAVEKAAASLAAPQERLKKLLEARDKKAVLLEMAGNNEIDRALIDLLDQNIETAAEQKQEQAAEFMRKVKQAALRYLV